MAFGPFRLLPRQRLLLEAGKPIPVGSRAFDLLIALLERPGELLRKEELITRVWSSTHVVEGNLKFQVAALRRALRDGQDGRRYLETNPGQGYRFVADVTVESDAAPVGPSLAASPDKHNVPARLTALLGRADLIARLIDRLPTERLVTLVGPGGIGKTSVALATAEQLIGAYEDGVWRIDFGWLASPAVVWGAVAAAVGINVNAEAPLASLIAALRDTRMLLVLDNCSHVIDDVARLAVAILKGAPGVHILATSREPLRVEGEHIHRLGPLESPPASERLSAAEALRFPAVQFFVERATASDDGFELRDDEAPLVAEICRTLDGIPLAIGLAAARVDVLGVRGLAAQLDDLSRILTFGRRTALARHRTMRATLDWSYGLLSPSEQTVFLRLAVFVGGFTLAAASEVAGDPGLSGDEVASLVLELATKSLVAAGVDLPEPRFRLLQTTRAYALEKGRESGEPERLARRHALYFQSLFEAASTDDEAFDERSGALALEIDNLRAALGWAFAPGGDVTVGIGLTVASVPLWLSMALLGEWHVWAERSIHSLDEAGLRDTRQEMVLRAGLGISFQLVKGTTSEAHATLTRALELAERLDDPDYRMRILHTLWIYHVRIGEPRTAMALARRADAIAASLADPAASATAEWMLGISLLWGGEHRAARRRLEHLLQSPLTVPRSRFVCRAGFDLYVPARYVLAHILWLQGCPDQARQVLQMSVEEARRSKNPVTLCSALGLGGCALFIRAGDVDSARRLATELVGYARKHALADYLAYGAAVQEILSLRKEGANAGVEHLRVALQRWRASGWHIVLTIGDFAEFAADAASCIQEISPIIDEELERTERHQELWTLPNALRVKGELLLLQDDPDPERAKEYFRRSLYCAHSQGALSWELRAAMSLARLERSQGRTDKARQLLQGVYDRFTEGFDTVDLKRAKRLLAELGGRSTQQAGTAPGATRRLGPPDGR